MNFDQKLELGIVASGGAWSLGTVLMFATGNTRTAYTMLAFGTILTTALALIRVAGSDRSLPEVVEV